MKVKKFTPINVLWIEDNPLWKRIPCSNLKSENGEQIFESSLDDHFIPAIEFTDELEGYEKFFNLNVLQHPEEIKEYLTLCLKVEDTLGAHSLGAVEGIVPELVVFDYKLSENIKINRSGADVFSMSYSKPTEPIRKYINPNFAIIKNFKVELNDFKLHLEDPKNNGYDQNEFIRRINSPDKLTESEIEEIKSKIKDDEFGLYGGIEIVKHFRQHICVGIPATANKADKKLLHPLSRHYEWLNENDLSTALDREERDNKTWNAILKDSVKQLRKRIISLVQSNKIVPQLTELLQLGSGIISAEKVFSFSSAYGMRHLPLEGLFMDTLTNILTILPEELQKYLEITKKSMNELSVYEGNLSGKKEIAGAKKNTNELGKLITQIEENRKRQLDLKNQIHCLENFTQRDYEIWKFANNILSILGFEQNELTEALIITRHLWNEFDSINFKKRFLLSDYYARKVFYESDSNGEGKKFKLTNLEQDHLNNFIEELVGGEASIDFDKKKGVIKEQYTALGDFRDITEGKSETTCRFVFFFIALNLIKRWADFIESFEYELQKVKEYDEYFFQEATRAPDEKDIFFALFPIARYPFILFPHQRILNKTNKGYKENPIEGYQKVFERLKLRYLSRDLNFSECINSAEKKIIKAYANGLDFPETSKHYPHWLK